LEVKRGVIMEAFWMRAVGVSGKRGFENAS
jgi:hypothetical protein